MAREKEKKTIIHHLRRSILTPSKAPTIWMFLLGAIIAGFAFGVGGAIATRTMNYASQEAQKDIQRISMARSFLASTKGPHNQPGLRYRSRWNY